MLDADLEPYPWIPSRAKLEEWADEPVGTVLGCAAWGCVFQLADSRVLKITSDEDEVAAVEAIEEARAVDAALPGIMHVFEPPDILGKLPKSYWTRGPSGALTKTTIYAYVREEVVPLPDDFEPEQRYRRGKSPYEYEKSALGIVTDVADDIMRGKGKLSALRDEYLKWVDVASHEYPFQAVALSLGRLAMDFGVYLYDVDTNNIGLTAAGTPALFDFMLARPPKKKSKSKGGA